VNAYERNTDMPVARWVNEDKLRCINNEKIPGFNDTSGLRLPRVYRQKQGSSVKVLTEKNLVKYRSSEQRQSKTDGAVINPYTPAELRAVLDNAVEKGVYSALENAGLARVITSEQLPDDVLDAAFSMRIMPRGFRTKNDFIIPETPEFAGNETGDLAYLDGKPIRLTTGAHYGSHRGFGIVKLAGEADASKRREPPSYTEDRAENFARHVVAVANSADAQFAEDGKTIIRSSRMKEALVLEDMGDYFSITSLRPAEKVVWGVPVRTGRGLVQSLSQCPLSVIGC